MKLKPIANNQTETHHENGRIILYSYETPVAAFVPGRGGVCTKTKYSPTTSRHVNKALARWGCSRVDVDQAEFDAIL